MEKCLPVFITHTVFKSLALNPALLITCFLRSETQVVYQETSRPICKMRSRSHELRIYFTFFFLHTYIIYICVCVYVYMYVCIYCNGVEESQDKESLPWRVDLFNKGLTV